MGHFRWLFFTTSPSLWLGIQWRAVFSLVPPAVIERATNIPGWRVCWISHLPSLLMSSSLLVLSLYFSLFLSLSTNRTFEIFDLKARRIKEKNWKSKYQIKSTLGVKKIFIYHIFMSWYCPMGVGSGPSAGRQAIVGLDKPYWIKSLGGVCWRRRRRKCREYRNLFKHQWFSNRHCSLPSLPVSLLCLLLLLLFPEAVSIGIL